jgi:hypothetical protein
VPTKRVGNFLNATRALINKRNVVRPGFVYPVLLQLEVVFQDSDLSKKGVSHQSDSQVERPLFFAMRTLTVTGRMKTSHLGAIQNQPL